MKYDSPLFGLNETLQGTDDDGNLINKEYVGTKIRFPGQRYTGGVRGSKARYNSFPIDAVAIRNVSSAALAPGALVKLDTTVSDPHDMLGQADALAGTANDYPVVAVSGFITAGTTVAVNDIFWGIYCGPTQVLTASSGLQDASPGDHIVVGGTSNGGVDKISGTPTVAEAMALLGFYLESVTGATDTNALKWASLTIRL